MFVLILRCREGEGTDEVLETMLWGKVAKRRLGSGVLPASGPWWLQGDDRCLLVLFSCIEKDVNMV